MEYCIEFSVFRTIGLTTEYYVLRLERRNEPLLDID